MDYECSEEIAVILAMMQIQNVFNPEDNRHMAEVTKRKFAVEEGDHLTMLNVYTCFVEVSTVSDQELAFRTASRPSGAGTTTSTSRVSARRTTSASS